MKGANTSEMRRREILHAHAASIVKLYNEGRSITGIAVILGAARQRVQWAVDQLLAQKLMKRRVRSDGGVWNPTAGDQKPPLSLDEINQRLGRHRVTDWPIEYDSSQIVQSLGNVFATIREMLGVRHAELSTANFIVRVQHAESTLDMGWFEYDPRDIEHQIRNGVSWNDVFSRVRLLRGERRTSHARGRDTLEPVGGQWKYGELSSAGFVSGDDPVPLVVKFGTEADRWRPDVLYGRVLDSVRSRYASEEERRWAKEDANWKHVNGTRWCRYRGSTA